VGYWGFAPYVTVAEKRAKAARKLEQLKKKNNAIRPILIEGRAIARTWWGKSWNNNLERYADYSNRIGRGRSYVRHGAVLDLQIAPGGVRSLVQGSRSKPYSVDVKIKAIKKKIWQEIKSGCEGKLESIQELLGGKFPKALGEIFMAQGQGLFPTPREIEFNCSCPDWAYMCKHVAATLYGVGARLDEDPTLFFILRKVKQDDLIAQAIREGSRKLLKKAKKKSKRVIADTDLSEMFGIDIDEKANLEIQSSSLQKGTRAGKKPAKKTKKVSRPKTGVKTKKAMTVSKKRKPKKTASRVVSKKPLKSAKPIRRKTKVKRAAKSNDEQVLRIIKRSRKGVDVPMLRKRTGLDEVFIRNTIFRAFKKGIIRRVSRGIYLSA